MGLPLGLNRSCVIVQAFRFAADLPRFMRAKNSALAAPVSLPVRLLAFFTVLFAVRFAVLLRLVLLRFGAPSDFALLLRLVRFFGAEWRRRSVAISASRLMLVPSAERDKRERPYVLSWFWVERLPACDSDE
jgi:hypothetical protein